MKKALLNHAYVLTVLILVSCTKSKINYDQITENETISRQTGIPLKYIIDKGDYYQVDNCIRVPKGVFSNKYRRQVIAHQDYPTPGVETWYVPINLQYQNNIKVYLDLPLEYPATDSSNWKQAMSDAMHAYNNLIWLSNIHFIRVYNEWDADIKIHIYYSNTDGLAGSAKLPAYGQPGQDVYFNTYYNYYTLPEKVMVAVHELGHSLGFLHTDGPQTGRFYDASIPTYFNIWQVLGTPSSDTSSVFNSDVASRRLSFLQTIDNYGERGFSAYDKEAIIYLYNYTWGSHYIVGPQFISGTGSYYYSFKPSILGSVSWNAWDLSDNSLINESLSCTTCDTTTFTFPVGVDSVRLVGATAGNTHLRYIDIYRQ